MTTEAMIEKLRWLSQKHKKDIVFIGNTNWSVLCAEVADRLEELYNIRSDNNG